MGAASQALPGRPWRLAAGWLLFLGPFFYLSYGGANWLASQRAQVGSVVFGWESAVPFVAWTILPYWSLNLFYAASLFVHRSPAAVNALGRQLLTAQLVAVACFVAFPLTCTYLRPETHGVPGVMFAALAGFDKPFNQAPSLHIALLVILWPVYARAAPAGWRWLLHVWFLLIGISVMTTYQHHFIDIPTGALLGFMCRWLWPAYAPSPLRSARWTPDPRRRRLALYYALGAAFCVWLALRGGWALWWSWPAVSLGLVSLCYALLGEVGFQKGRADRDAPYFGAAMSTPARWLLAPYLAAAWFNARCWTARDAPSVEVADGVHVGRLPGRGTGGFAAVVDLCAELPGRPAAPGRRRHAIPMLDLVVPRTAQLQASVLAIEAARRHGSVLVCCALGYSRSVSAVAAWLLATGRVGSAAAAVDRLRQVRPQLVLSLEHLAAIEELKP